MKSWRRIVTPACLQRQVDNLVGDAVAMARVVEVAVTQTERLGALPKGAGNRIKGAAARWSAQLAAIDNNSCGDFST